MIAKKFRLPVKKTFFQRSQSLRGNYFLFKRKATDLPLSRFGVVVSRKIQKSAVARNRLKRIIFEFIRSKKLYLQPGGDLLIIALPPSGQVAEGEILKELEKSVTLF